MSLHRCVHKRDISWIILLRRLLFEGNTKRRELEEVEEMWGPCKCSIDLRCKRLLRLVAGRHVNNPLTNDLLT